MAAPKKGGSRPLFTVTIDGAEQVRTVIQGRMMRAMDLRPSLNVVADLLQAQTAENIRTRGGGLAERWKPLAASTVRARRERWGYYGRNAPGAGVAMTTPLVWTGGMAGSFRAGGKHHVRRIQAQSMEWGSSHPIIAFHNSREPRSKIPFRPMLGFRDEGQKRVLTVEPVRMWMAGMSEAQIRAEAFGRSGLAFRRAG